MIFFFFFGGKCYNYKDFSFQDFTEISAEICTKLVRKCLFQGCQSVECLPQRIHLCGVLVSGSVMEPDCLFQSVPRKFAIAVLSIGCVAVK